MCDFYGFEHQRAKQQEQSSPWDLDIQFEISSKPRIRLPRPTKSLGLIASARSPPLDRDNLHKPSRDWISGWAIFDFYRIIELEALFKATGITALVLHTTSAILIPSETSSIADGTTWATSQIRTSYKGAFEVKAMLLPLAEKPSIGPSVALDD